MPNATPTESPVDPYRAYNVRLKIQNVTEGYFTQCSGRGLNFEAISAISYREGGAGGDARRLPGRPEHGEITLHYGVITQSADLWDWLMKTRQSKVIRKNISIVVLDSDGQTEGVQWNLIHAWPSEWRGAPLDAMAQEVAIESLTLVYEYLNRE